MDVCTKFGDSRLKTSVASFLGGFSNTNTFRPEVESDVISGVVVDPTGTKVREKLGDSRSTHSHFVTNNDYDDAGHHGVFSKNRAIQLTIAHNSWNRYL